MLEIIHRALIDNTFGEMMAEESTIEITDELLGQVADWDAEYNPVGWIYYQLVKTHPDITIEETRDLVAKSREWVKNG